MSGSDGWFGLLGQLKADREIARALAVPGTDCPRCGTTMQPIPDRAWSPVAPGGWHCPFDGYIGEPLPISTGGRLVSATNAAAGLASGTGAAYPATVTASGSTASASAGVATGTGSAGVATVAVSGSAGVATGTGSAGSASVAVSGSAGPAAGTGAAGPGAVAVSSAAGVASGTGSANTPRGAASASAGAATGTGSAGAATVAVSGAAGAATGTGSAGAPVPNVGARPTAATGTGAANAATVTTTGGFSPTDAPGLLGWWDARAVSGSLASPSNPSNGAAVSQWDDLSGNANHATQATSANQPAYDSSLPGLTWEQSDRMATAVNGAAIRQVYAVVRASAFDADHNGIIGTAAGGGLAFRANDTGGQLRLERDAEAGIATATYAFGTGTTRVLAASYSNAVDGGAVGTWIIRASGAQIATDVSGTVLGTDSKPMRLGSTTANKGWQGAILAVLVYGQVHDATTVGNVESYLTGAFS